MVAPRIFGFHEKDSRPWKNAVSLRPDKGLNGRYRCVRNHCLSRDGLESQNPTPYHLSNVKAIKIPVAARETFNFLEMGSRFWRQMGAMLFQLEHRGRSRCIAHYNLSRDRFGEQARRSRAAVIYEAGVLCHCI